MADVIVRDWIADYKSLRSAEIHTFGCEISQNNELIQAVFSVLEEKRYHEELLEPVCHQFFSFYRSREENLQNFARQYIPCLVGLYLSSIAKGNRKNVRCVEVVLLGIYNLEVIDSSGKSSCLSFRIPLLSKPSIYHEPMSLSHTLLTERALSSLEYADSRVITVGPYSEVEKLNANNRLQVMTVLMWLYNQHIGHMSTFSHMSLCKMCSRVVKQGFNRRYDYNHPRPMARIPVSAPFLLEMLHGVYFSTFNGLASVGLQTLDELHGRALQEMMAEVLLATNAVRHSLKVSPQPCDGPMGISVALSPTAVVSTVSRAITNASFRAKKLPDDIPIQESETNENHQLSAINEEGEEEVPRGKKNNSFGITKVGVLQLRKGKKEDDPLSFRFKTEEDNHVGSEVVITNDGKCVKSILHKSESSNGIQNSSMQTAV